MTISRVKSCLTLSDTLEDDILRTPPHVMSVNGTFDVMQHLCHPVFLLCIIGRWSGLGSHVKSRHNFRNLALDK